MTHYFVGLPRDDTSGKALKTYLYDSVNGKRVRQVLWGDWLNVIDPDPEETLDPDWLKLRWAPASAAAEILYIPKLHVEATRPLEIVFIDVGQGDGAVLITPERDTGEAIFVIDAGINDKMHEFLRKRFNPYETSPQFHAAIVTHPDEDHYKGFESIFLDHSIGFDIIYQNGMVERAGFSGFDKVGGGA